MGPEPFPAPHFHLGQEVQYTPLDSTNNGKWFSSRFRKDRARAMEDSSSFTAAELAYLEVSWPDGTINNYPDALKLNPEPFDVNPTQKGKRINLEDLPPVGGPR